MTGCAERFTCRASGPADVGQFLAEEPLGAILAVPSRRGGGEGQRLRRGPATAECGLEFVASVVPAAVSASGTVFGPPLPNPWEPSKMGADAAVPTMSFRPA